MAEQFAIYGINGMKLLDVASVKGINGLEAIETSYAQRVDGGVTFTKVTAEEARRLRQQILKLEHKQ